MAALRQFPLLIPAINLLRPAIQLRLPAQWSIPIPLLRVASMSFPVNSFATGSTILRDIWESLLRAVPKKKTTHSKKRMRQMAGKALKNVTYIVNCSSCGKPKKAHHLCPYCVQATRLFWRGKLGQLTDWMSTKRVSMGTSTATSSTTRSTKKDSVDGSGEHV